MSATTQPKVCRCGSRAHVRVTHKLCPLNPKNVSEPSDAGSTSKTVVPGGALQGTCRGETHPALGNTQRLGWQEQETIAVKREANDENAHDENAHNGTQLAKCGGKKVASTGGKKEAPKKERQLEVDASRLPRIGETTSTTALKAEAKARGGVPPGYSRCSRETLLEELGVGSIMLSATREFRFVERVKALMHREHAAQSRKSPDEASRLKLEAERTKHTICLPQLHACLLAPASALLDSVHSDAPGRRADLCCQCEACGQHKNPALSCLECGFDVCGACVEKACACPKQTREKVDDHKSRKKHSKVQPGVVFSPKKKQEKKPALGNNALLPSVDPLDDIISTIDAIDSDVKVPPTVKSGFVVWSRRDDDVGPGRKVYDSSWASADDANRRAEFLFYSDNPFGLEPLDMHPERVSSLKDWHATTGHRLHRLVYSAEPSKKHPQAWSWTVAVCAAADFHDFHDDYLDSLHDAATLHHDIVDVDVPALDFLGPLDFVVA